MLGPPKKPRRDEVVHTFLEQRLPASNFYRHLDAKLDLSFVRDWVSDWYAERGRPSIDPVVFFRLQLILFFESIRSERKLIETADLHLAHRWYLSYSFDESLPDHSSPIGIRSRLGLPVADHGNCQAADQGNLPVGLPPITGARRSSSERGWAPAAGRHVPSTELNHGTGLRAV